MKITIVNDSIIKQDVDAIVNPANSFCYMGGGVAAVLKQLGGDQIEEEAIEQAPVEVGKAIITTAGDLKADVIIHAPTMHEPAQKTDGLCVQHAVEASLELADEQKFKTIAFPGMGTGVGCVPFEEAAEIMVKSVKDFKAKHLEEVFLVDVKNEMIKAWQEALKL